MTKSRTPAIQMPTRNSIREDGDAVLGIWADRPETGEEIAREIRRKNNGESSLSSNEKFIKRMFETVKGDKQKEILINQILIDLVEEERKAEQKSLPSEASAPLVIERRETLVKARFKVMRKIYFLDLERLRWLKELETLKNTSGCAK